MVFLAFNDSYGRWGKRWKIGKLNIENEQYRKMWNCEYSKRNLALHTQSDM